MVRAQRAAMMDPSAPTPSVEAILHALIPFRFVDHSHSDAVVTLSNTPNGEAEIRALYGFSVLISCHYLDLQSQGYGLALWQARRLLRCFCDSRPAELV